MKRIVPMILPLMFLVSIGHHFTTLAGAEINIIVPCTTPRPGIISGIASASREPREEHQ